MVRTLFLFRSTPPNLLRRRGRRRRRRRRRGRKRRSRRRSPPYGPLNPGTKKPASVDSVNGPSDPSMAQDIV